MDDLERALSAWLTMRVAENTLDYVYSPDAGTYVVLDNGGRRWTITVKSEDDQ